MTPPSRWPVVVSLALALAVSACAEDQSFMDALRSTFGPDAETAQSAPAGGNGDAANAAENAQPEPRSNDAPASDSGGEAPGDGSDTDRQADRASTDEPVAQNDPSQEAGDAGANEEPLAEETPGEAGEQNTAFDAESQTSDEEPLAADPAREDTAGEPGQDGGTTEPLAEDESEVAADGEPEALYRTEPVEQRAQTLQAKPLAQRQDAIDGSEVQAQKRALAEQKQALIEQQRALEEQRRALSEQQALAEERRAMAEQQMAADQQAARQRLIMARQGGKPAPAVSPVASDRSRGAAKRASPGDDSGERFANVLIRVATTAAANGNHATAVKMYRRAQRLTPHRIEPALGLGRSLAALGDHVGAVEATREALKIDPRNSEAHLGLGKELLALDRPHQAIPHLEIAASSRSDPNLYNDLGVAQDMVGDSVSAQAYYRSGLQIVPDDLALLSNLGISLALDGAFDEAIQLLQRAANNPAASVQHRENLALAYILAGNRIAARKVSLIDLSPDQVDKRLAYYSLLRGMNQAGDRQTIVTLLAGRGKGGDLTSAAEAHAKLAGIPSGKSSQQARLPKELKQQSEVPPPPTTRPEKLWRDAGRDTADAMGQSRRKGAMPGASAPPAVLTERMAPEAIPPRRTRRTATASLAARGAAGVAGPVVYVAQLAAYRTPEDAEVGWDLIRSAAPTVLGGLDHVIRPPNPDFSWDRLFRLRTTALANQSAAERLCAKPAAKSLECLVVETRTPQGPPPGSASFVGVVPTAPGKKSARTRGRVDPTAVPPLAMSARRAHPSGDVASTGPARTGGPPAPTAPASGRGVPQPGIDTEMSAPSADDQLARTMSTMRARGTADVAYEVQLAAYYRHRHAERGWRILRRRAPDLLAGVEHVIKGPNRALRSDSLFRLRTTAYQDRMRADRLCARLRSQGLECLVVETRDTDYAPRVPARGKAKRKAAAKAAVAAPPPGKPIDASAPRRLKASLPPPTPIPSEAYQVQLAAYGSPELALKGWKDFTKAAPDLLAKLDYIVTTSDPGGGFLTQYRLRTQTFPDWDSAAALCRKLKPRAIQCRVVRNDDPMSLLGDVGAAASAKKVDPPAPGKRG